MGRKIPHRMEKIKKEKNYLQLRNHKLKKLTEFYDFNQKQFITLTITFNSKVIINITTYHILNNNSKSTCKW